MGLSTLVISHTGIPGVSKLMCFAVACQTLVMLVPNAETYRCPLGRSRAFAIRLPFAETLGNVMNVPGTVRSDDASGCGEGAILGASGREAGDSEA
jgi:hypothetical protein